jgi:signal transduction histidine kinase/ActR/RegA family two-component response regulator
MSEPAAGNCAERVLVLAPTAKDAELVVGLLRQAGVHAAVCSDVASICRALEDGAAGILLPEEAVSGDDAVRLLAWLSRQPPWSDLPILVMARSGADSSSVAKAMDLLGNVTVLERPMRISSLVSAVRSALRARRRQYQIREHLAERERAAVAMREADRRKDEFLAILAHELRNPLAPIRNSLYILQLSGRDDPTARRVGEMMERQVSHMVRLVDDLLEVSRITRGKIELKRENVDIAVIVRNAVETSRPLIDAALHSLTVAVPRDELFVDGDPMRLAQVFANLLNNAAKYTDPRGRVAIAGRREGDHAVVSVRDSGTGIPADMLPRVFELFTQVGKATERANGGLGIGLTLAKSIVELHGGSIEARSEGPGRGSEFIVRLPLGERAGRTAAVSDAVPREPLAAQSVLIVDDNRDAAESLAMLLRLLGLAVRVADNGGAALQAIDDDVPDVMFLDIGMPGMDGYEVARQVRRRRGGADVLLVALTGWGQDDDRRRARAAGFDHHLVKPADVDDLKALLQSVRSRGQPVASAS